MLKTLLKKQFLSVLSRLGGKKKAGKGISGYIGIVLIITVLTGVIFYFYANMLARPLAAAGMGWLYFVYAGVMSIVISVVMGMFMTQSCLYEAKDNELLLSMPIPPKYILFVRMVPLYAQSLLFSAGVLVSSTICWGVVVGVTAAQVIIALLMVFILPLLSLFLSCLIGLLIALITARMRDKTLFTVIVSIVFITAFFVLYMIVLSNIGALVTQSAAIGEGIKKGFYPLYKLGAAFMGDFVGLAITAVIVAALFGGLYFVLSKTYIGMITKKRGGKRARYNGKIEKPSSPSTALLKKEVRRFFSSGVYFLNAGLGVIMLFIATLIIAIKSGDILSALGSIPALGSAMPLLIVLGVSFISAMDGVSAPSISLEGKTLWILQSSPVELWRALKAKLMLHYLVTGPAATVCMAVFAAILQPPWYMIILMLIAPSAAVMLSGVFGLTFNLKKPNLQWENETVVIKQSSSVLFTMLACWGVLGLFGGLYFAAALVMPPALYLLICLVLMTGGIAGLTLWLRRRGVAILEKL